MSTVYDNNITQCQYGTLTHNTVFIPSFRKLFQLVSMMAISNSGGEAINAEGASKIRIVSVRLLVGSNCERPIFQSQFCPYDNYGGQIGTEAGLCPRTSAFPCHIMSQIFDSHISCIFH
jgi:hypothetical protein